jgi:hypothetical protein
MKCGFVSSSVAVNVRVPLKPEAMEEIVLLEAVLQDYSPRTTVINPFKPTAKRWLASIRPVKPAPVREIVGKVQVWNIATNACR